MAYIIDIGVILIFALAVFIGHKRGFIKTMSGVLAFVAALTVAMLLKAPIAGLVYDKAVEPPLLETLETSVNSVTEGYNSLPEVVRHLLFSAGVASGEQLSGQAADLLRTAVYPVVETLCSFVLFLIGYIAASILLKAADLVAKLPLLKQINGALGFVAGIISGVLWVALAISVLQIVVVTGIAGDVLPAGILEETLLTKWLHSINPLSYLPL